MIRLIKSTLSLGYLFFACWFRPIVTMDVSSRKESGGNPAFTGSEVSQSTASIQDSNVPRSTAHQTSTVVSLFSVSSISSNTIESTTSQINSQTTSSTTTRHSLQDTTVSVQSTQTQASSHTSESNQSIVHSRPPVRSSSDTATVTVTFVYVTNPVDVHAEQVSTQGPSPQTYPVLSFPTTIATPDDTLTDKQHATVSYGSSTSPLVNIPTPLPVPVNPTGHSAIYSSTPTPSTYGNVTDVPVPQDDSSRHPNIALIAGITSTLVGLLIILTICVLYTRHRSRRHTTQWRSRLFDGSLFDSTWAQSPGASPHARSGPANGDVGTRWRRARARRDPAGQSPVQQPPANTAAVLPPSNTPPSIRSRSDDLSAAFPTVPSLRAYLTAAAESSAQPTPASILSRPNSPSMDGRDVVHTHYEPDPSLKSPEVSPFDDPPPQSSMRPTSSLVSSLRSIDADMPNSTFLANTPYQNINADGFVSAGGRNWDVGLAV